MAKATHHSKTAIEKAEILAEALPYMRRFSGQTFVIKFGGHVMGDESLTELFAQDVVLLKHVGINPVVVHGGGPQISNMLDRLKIESSFIQGLRVTDAATVEIVEMVLSGSINKQIASAINRAGGRAVGISGKDGGLIEARKLKRRHRDPQSNIERVLDLGFVGEPTSIHVDLLTELSKSQVIPVIAPIGSGKRGETFNINADTVAGALAGALQASKLIMLTDVAGVLDGKGKLLATLTPRQARGLLSRTAVTGGMIPKIETCLDALKLGTAAAHILDGRVPHAVLLEVFTALGVGTMIRPAK